MAVIDYASIYYTMFLRAKNSSALLALVGESASIFEENLLDVYGHATAANRPKLPWVVWCVNGVSGSSNSMRPLNASAWAYDDLTLGDQRLLDIASVINDLFGSISKDAIPYGDLSIPYVGRPIPDRSLANLRSLETRIQYNRRS